MSFQPSYYVGINVVRMHLCTNRHIRWVTMQTSIKRNRNKLVKPDKILCSERR